MSGYRKKQKPVIISEQFRIPTEDTVRNFVLDDTVTEHVFPPNLSKLERAFIHDLCKKYGLQSKSRGKEPKRCLRIFKKTKTAPMDECYIGLTDFGYSAIRKLLVSYPMSTRELHDIKPDSEGYRKRTTTEVAVDVINKTMGRLHGGAPRIPPSPTSNPFDSVRQQLPIAEYRRVICKTISDNQITLICGETGSGKTTQVPQFILEEGWMEQKECRVICTQPRRLSAVAVAERVAAERGEVIGQTVGFQIRLESRVSPRTMLTYCTNGVLLRSLMSGMACLNSVTHIIVDEVHERDRFSDFLLICLRECLVHNKKLKLVLMSATMDTTLFMQYFTNPPVIAVPGRQFQVTDYFLEDVLRITSYMTHAMAKFENEVTSDSSYKNQQGAQSMQLMREQAEEESKSNIVLETQVASVIDSYILDCWRSGSMDAFVQLMHTILSENVPVDYQHSTTGVSTLMVAAVHGNINVVEQLLNMGANVQLTSHNNQTAREWAKSQGHQDIVDLLTVFSNKPNENDVSTIVQSSGDQHRLALYQHSVCDDFVDYQLALELIIHLHLNTTLGSILIFLPGYHDIVTMKNILLEEPRFHQGGPLKCFTLHSQMQTMNQKQVFLPTPGFRKIILSTNIAETSITIEDVVYVVDAGKVKEKSFDAGSDVSSLHSAWISQSCAKQRAGRAGRTMPGFCFHLFSRTRFQNMQIYPTPEILRMPLHELCLHTKMLAPTEMSIADFLSLAMEPPSPMVTRNAVQSLKNLGALDENEALTSLGLHLVELAVEPHLGKIVLYGVLLKCLDPILTIVSCLSYKDPFTLPAHPSQRRAATMSRVHLSAGTFSDHMALLRAFQMWQMSSVAKDKNYCDRNYISAATMEMVLGMRGQLLGQLRAAGFVKNRAPGDIRDLNHNAENWAIVKAALSAGLYPNLARVDRHSLHLRTQREKRVMFHPSSVLRDSVRTTARSSASIAGSLAKLPSDWLVYDEISRSGRFCLIRGATIVTPITVLLFTGPLYIPPEAISFGGNVSDDEDNDNDAELTSITLDNWIAFYTNPEHVDELLHLRNKWHALVMRRMHQPSKHLTSNDEHIIQCMVDVLTAEEHSVGLKQPSGVGQRPKSYIPEYNNTGMRQYSSNLGNGGPVNRSTYRPPSASTVGGKQIPRQITKHPDTVIETQNKLLQALHSGLQTIENGLESETSSLFDSVSQYGSEMSNMTGSLGQMRLNNLSTQSPSSFNGQSSSSYNSQSGACARNNQSYSQGKQGSSTCSGYFTYDKTDSIDRDFESNGRTVTDSDDSSSVNHKQSLNPIQRKYFVVKVPALHMIDISITKKTWIFQSHLEQKFVRILQDGAKPILIFTVQGSNHFQGIAELISGPRVMKNCRQSFCAVKWISRANLSFQATRHLMNSFNSNRRVHSCPDGQEVDPSTGAAICDLFTTIDPEVPLQMDPPSPPQHGRPIRRRNR